MINSPHPVVNAIIALALSVSPQLVDKYGSKIINTEKLRAEAQRQAAYIVQTGDLSRLEKISDGMLISPAEIALITSMVKAAGLNLDKKTDIPSL